ncbi:hypothetical protein [Bacillus paralicheniformis]|uniref:hypothetical protein n=1 Tax=Bacillus paralicheniformis TaxID=1648923 RepID=UPI002E1F85ED|nr:hypothetical protein [Bacillus paralicheniformis]
MFFANKRTKHNEELAIINENPNEREREVDGELANEDVYEANDEVTSFSFFD